MRIRKRTIYIDSDLDKEFAKAAIDAELTFSKMRSSYICGELARKVRGAPTLEIIITANNYCNIILFTTNQKHSLVAF